MFAHSRAAVAAIRLNLHAVKRRTSLVGAHPDVTQSSLRPDGAHAVARRSSGHVLLASHSFALTGAVDLPRSLSP